MIHDFSFILSFWKCSIVTFLFFGKVFGDVSGVGVFRGADDDLL